MIQLKIGDEYLDVPEDIAISLQLNNPLFNEDNLSPGSYSLPFTLPVGDRSPKNARLLGVSEVREALNTTKKVNCQLLFDGVPLKRGELVNGAIKNQRISNNFKFGLTTLDPGVKTKKLRDVIDEDVVIGSSATTKELYLRPYFIDLDAISNNVYRININGRDYENVDLSALVTAINDDNTSPRVTASYHAGATPGGLDGPHIKLIPRIDAEDWSNATSYDTNEVALYNGIVWKSKQDANINNPPAENAYWTSQGEPLITDITDPYCPFFADNSAINQSLKDIANWNCEAYGLDDYFTDFDNFIADYLVANPADDRFRFPALFNDSVKAEKDASFYNFNPLYATVVQGSAYFAYNSKTSNYTNMVNADGLIKNRLAFQRFEYYFNWNSLAPYLRMRWVLDKIAEYLGVTLAGDFLPLIGNILLYNPNGIDLPLRFWGSQNYLFWKREFNCNELVPDISVIDFLTGISTRYNIGITFNELTRELVLTRRGEVAKSSEYVDITSLAGRVEEDEDISPDGLAFKTEIDESDAYAVADDYTVGNGEKPVKITASGLPGDFTHKVVFDAIQNTALASFGDAYTYTAAQVTGPLVSQQATPRYGLRFFHYKGLVDNGVFTYAQASAHADDWDETIDGENGIFEYFYKYWSLFEAGRKRVVLPVRWGIEDLKDFDWELKQRFDRNNYLVKSISVRITHQKIEASEVELYSQRL